MCDANFCSRPILARVVLSAAMFAFAASLDAKSVPGWDALSQDAVAPLPENTAVRLESPGRFRMDADLSVLKRTKRAGWDF